LLLLENLVDAPWQGVSLNQQLFMEGIGFPLHFSFVCIAIPARK
jgi:hypothetical protein